MVERLNGIQKVAGSIPTTSTKTGYFSIFLGNNRFFCSLFFLGGVILGHEIFECLKKCQIKCQNLVLFGVKSGCYLG